MNTNYITDEVRSLIGMESAPVEATHPVEASETRRFHQATMDEAPRHWDANWARQSRYGTLVAPPAFPVHAFRRAAGTPDPLGAMGEQDFDGLNRQLRPSLPPVKVPLVRLLNGGYDYEFYRYARPGERIFRRTSTSGTARAGPWCSSSWRTRTRTSPATRCSRPRTTLSFADR